MKRNGRFLVGQGCAVLRFALALASVGALGGLQAQVVKAPRYQSPVDAPVRQVSLPPLPTAITPHGTVVEDIVVRINDQIISRSDVMRQQQQLDEAASQANARPEDVAGEQKNMLRDMIDQQLLLSRAKELGLNADAELIRRLDEIRKGNNLATMDDLEKAARSQGVNFEDFKAQQKNQILTQMVVRDEVGRRLQLTTGDQKKYYAEHLGDFTQPEQVHLSEILIPTPENATAEQVAQAEAKAKEVRGFASTQDFAALAKKYSGGPTAAQGGDLGSFKSGVLPKVFEDATFQLPVGATSDPIRSKQGFVVLKVTAHDAAGPAPITDKDVEQKIEEAMYMQQMQPALRAYLTKLREQAYVDIQPGFVDAGASPSEAKSILNSAYAPPPVKKKAVKQKARFDRSGRNVTVAQKKSVVSSPDTTGGRTLTGADSVAAAPAGVDLNTGLAVISAPKANGKEPKMAKREKIRFGQAPRTALPSAGEDSAGGDAPNVAAAAAPGALIASNGVGTAESANLQDNALTPTLPDRGKTRFAAKSQEVKVKKAQTVSAKQAEKALAKPEPVSADEKVAAQVQAAPLGLAGDTTKKPRKPKREKGAPKQRLEEKPVAPKPGTTPVDQTANPALAPTGVAPAPSAGAAAPSVPPAAPPQI